MNPYQVIGVSETATDEEVRAAYIQLVKKYHPDKYQDNPLKNLADEKLKEINEAYDTIQKERARAGYSGGTRPGGYSGSTGYSGNTGYSGSTGYSGNTGYAGYSGEFAAQFNRVRQMLNSNDIYNAKAVLDSIPNRNAEWHYLYGITLFRSGQYANARDHLEMASRMDPGNAEYRNAYNTTASRGTRTYHTYDSGTRSGADTLGTACNCCSTLWCADSCCECMGGDLCRCM